MFVQRFKRGEHLQSIGHHDNSYIDNNTDLLLLEMNFLHREVSLSGERKEVQEIC
jgi:hypothetical protein